MRHHIVLVLPADQLDRPKLLGPSHVRLIANHMVSWFHFGVSEYETAEPAEDRSLSLERATSTQRIPGTCVQHPGLQGGSALGDASTPDTPAGSMAASTPGGTYSHVTVAGGAWGGEMGAVAATAAAAARRRRCAGTITRGSSWARRTPEVAARGRRAQLGAVGGGRGANAVGAV